MTIPQKMTSIGHFGAIDDQSIRISIFFEEIWLQSDSTPWTLTLKKILSFQMPTWVTAWEHWVLLAFSIFLFPQRTIFFIIYFISLHETSGYYFLLIVFHLKVKVHKSKGHTNDKTAGLQYNRAKTSLSVLQFSMSRAGSMPSLKWLDKLNVFVVS